MLKRCCLMLGFLLTIQSAFANVKTDCDLFKQLKYGMSLKTASALLGPATRLKDIVLTTYNWQTNDNARLSVGYENGRYIYVALVGTNKNVIPSRFQQAKNNAESLTEFEAILGKPDSKQKTLEHQYQFKLHGGAKVRVRTNKRGKITRYFADIYCH